MPVPDFAPGEVLTAAAMDSIGLWLIKTQTIGNGVRSVLVTNVFSSNYDFYKVTISGGVAAANTLIAIQIGNAITGYYWAGQQTTWAGVSTIVNGANVANFQRVGFGTTNSLELECEITAPFLTKHTSIKAEFQANTTTGDSVFVGGYLNNSNSYTDFTVLTGQDMTGGTIRVYGYRN